MDILTYRQIIVIYKIRMKTIDLTKIYEQYKGLWVALTEKFEVISANKSAKKAYEDAKAKGYKKPRLFKMPQKNLPFVG